MSKLSKMREGGELHGQLRHKLYQATVVGATPRKLEALALKLLKDLGTEPSFTKVKDYHFATCINVNSGTVHGIPDNDTPFKDGDVVTLDVGVYHRGYHLDGAFTKQVGKPTNQGQLIIEGGLATLHAALGAVKAGNRVGDISSVTEKTLKSYGLSPFHELTGHGVGRTLHEDPMIPNYQKGSIDSTPQLVLGQTLAIEIIYTAGSPQLVLERDGWTISTKDGKLSGVFEETVEVTTDGYLIMTKPTLSQITKSGKIRTQNINQ